MCAYGLVLVSICASPGARLQPDVRKKISEILYKGLIKPEEVFVSDGAKCDIGRLQMMFGPGVTSAVQVS